MTSPSDNDKNKDAASDAKASGTRTKTDAYYEINEKIADIFVNGISNLFKKEQLEKIIQAKHFEKIKNLSQLQKILAITSVVVLPLVSLELMLWTIWISVIAYVLLTEKPWDEKSSKTFMIFKYPTGKLVAVKQGWSWPAFLFSWIWALLKQMWVRGAFVGLLCLVLYDIFNDEIFGNFLDVIYTLIAIAFGINGNLWCEKKLLLSGFQKTTTITAKNNEGAIATYLNQFKEKNNTDTDSLNSNGLHKDFSDKKMEISQQHNNQLIKCSACGKDMGVAAEICMGCGTKNPLRLAERSAQLEDIIKKLVPVVVTVVILIVIFSIFKGVTDAFFGYARALQGR